MKLLIYSLIGLGTVLIIVAALLIGELIHANDCYTATLEQVITMDCRGVY